MIELPTMFDKLMAVLAIFLFIIAMLGCSIFRKTGYTYVLAILFVLPLCDVFEASYFTLLLIVIVFFHVCAFIEFKSSDIITSLRKVDETRRVSENATDHAVFLIVTYVAMSIIIACLFLCTFYENTYELKPQIAELEAELEEAEELADSLQPPAVKKSDGFDIEAFAKEVEEYGRDAPKDSKSNLKQSSVEYVGNSNSSIVHKSRCSSVSRMSPSNMVHFDSLDEALDEGYRPCKKCKP